MAPERMAASHGNIRCVRTGKKPPPFILCSIGVVTCLLILASAALITIGYLNSPSTLGLGLLGVGAVLYFGAIVFLIMTCVWVGKKYPERQFLPTRVWTRRPIRMNTTLESPHISGAAAVVPPETLIGYRVHFPKNNQHQNPHKTKPLSGNLPRIPARPPPSTLDHQQKDLTPIAPNSGDNSTRQITSKIDSPIDDGQSVMEQEHDQRYQGLTNPTIADFASTESFDPSDGKSVSHDQQNQHHQSRHIIDASTGGFATPDSKCKAVSDLKQEQHNQKIPTQIPEFTDSSTTFTASPLMKREGVSQDQQNLQQDKLVAVTQSEDFTAKPVDSPPIDKRIVSNYQKGQSHQSIVATDLQIGELITKLPADPSSNSKIIKDEKQDQHLQEMSTISGVGKLTTLPSPCNTKTVSYTIKHQHLQDLLPVTPSSTDSTTSPVASLTIRKTASDHKPGTQNQEKPPRTPHARGLTGEPIASPPTSRKIISDHKHGQQRQNIPPTAPHIMELISVPAASPPASKKIIITDDKHGQQHQDVPPTTPRRKEFTTGPIASPPTNRKIIIDQTHGQQHQDIPPTATHTREFTTGPIASPPANRKIITDQTRGQQPQAIPPTAPRTRELTAAPSASPPTNRKMGTGHKHGQQPQDIPPTAPRTRDLTAVPNASPPTNRKMGTGHKHGQQPQDIPPTIPQTRKFTTGPATSPANRKIITDQTHGQQPQAIPSAPRAREFTAAPSAFPPTNRKTGTGHKHGQQPQDIPLVPPHTKEFITTPVIPPPRNKRAAQQNKQEHNSQDLPLAIPPPRMVSAASVASAPTESKITSGNNQGRHQAIPPIAPRTKDVTSLLALPPRKAASDFKQYHHQKDIPPVTSHTSDLDTSQAASPSSNNKMTAGQKEMQRQQETPPTAPHVTDSKAATSSQK